MARAVIEARLLQKYRTKARRWPVKPKAENDARAALEAALSLLGQAIADQAGFGLCCAPGVAHRATQPDARRIQGENRTSAGEGHALGFEGPRSGDATP